MRSLRAPVRPRRAQLRDPAPSKWGYRWQRLMLTPGFRALVRIGTPLLLIGVITATWVSDAENRAMLAARVSETKAAVQSRPEFMMTALQIDGVDPALRTQVAGVLPIAFPISSFDVDFAELRTNVLALPQVADASVKLGEDGALQVDVTPRVPVALWRDGEILRLIDATGVFAGEVETRSDRLDLPLVAGDGAYAEIDEALMLFRRAEPIAGRLRGLVRIGERRWDLVLDRGQRILLPSTGAGAALDRVILLEQANELLARDVVVVDLRNPARATIRLSGEAANALRRVSDRGADE